MVNVNGRITDQEHAVVLEDSSYFAEHFIEIEQMLQRLGHDDDVEGFVRKRRGGEVALHAVVDQVAVLLGVGDGTFLPAGLFSTGHIPWNIAIGDVNSDGNPDIVVADDGDSSITLLLGNGDGAASDCPTRPRSAATLAAAAAGIVAVGVHGVGHGERQTMGVRAGTTRRDHDAGAAWT